MLYRRMPIEVESPEERGYETLDCNLTESSVRDLTLDALGVNLSGLVLAYTDHRGKPSLRARLAEEGAGLKAEDVLLTAGAAAALFIVATSLLKAGDHLIVADPNYATNLETPRAIGCDVSTLPLRFEEGWRLDLDRLKSLLRPQTKLISLTAPHNPSGTVLSQAELTELIQLAESHGCYLLLDETYRELTAEPLLPLAASLSPKAISVSSLSKAYGLPGLRLGWLITQDPSLQTLFLAAKEQIYVCNSVLDEALADVAVAQKTTILPPILAHRLKAFHILKAWMSTESRLEWVEPKGGVVCFPRIKADAQVDVEHFYHQLNQVYNTWVGPGHWFGMDRRYMRLGYAWPLLPELERGLYNLSRALTDATRGSR